MNKIQLLLLLLVLSSVTSAQTISRDVVSSGGGTLSGGSNQITFAIGETVITSLSGGMNQITQGFEQPNEQILTGTVVTSTLCVGSNVLIPFSAYDIGGGNIFTAQLSNAAGSFVSPVIIGTISGNESGTMTGTIPLNTPLGTNYRIRVIASSPLTNGSDNGANLSLSGPIIITSVVTNANLGGNTGSAGITFKPETCTILWSSGETTNYISNKSPGTYTGTVTSPAGCVSSKTLIIN